MKIQLHTGRTLVLANCGVCCLEAALLYMSLYGLCKLDGTALQFHLWEDDACCAPRGIFKIKHYALDPATGEHGTVDERQLCSRSFYVDTCTLPVAVVSCSLRAEQKREP